MSKLAIRVYYTDVDDMPHNAKMVLMALAEHHNKKNGLTWPSAATIAKHLRISRRSTQRGLAWLKNNGYIKVVVPNHTGRDSVRYVIVEDRLSQIPGHTSDTKSLVSGSHQLVTGRRQTSDTVAQEPEREPVKELVSAGDLDESPAPEKAATCRDLLEELVACDWYTRAEAENLSKLPDSALYIILQDVLKALQAAIEHESDGK